MKIKKKTKKNKYRSTDDSQDRNIFIRVILIIICVDLLLLFAAFPIIENMMATALDPDTSDSALLLKTTLLTVIDIALFVSLYMIFSRRKMRNENQ